MTKPLLVHVFNNFRHGAISHIIRDLAPFVLNTYDVKVVCLQTIKEDPSLKDEYDKLGISVIPLNTSRLNLLGAAVKLICVLKKLKPAVVHAHAGRASMLVPFCSPQSASVYVTYHSLATGYSFLTRNVLRFTDRRLDGRTFVSNAVQKSWRKLGVRGGHIIPNPVNSTLSTQSETKAICLRKELGVGDDEVMLLNVGRLTKAKGQFLLLQIIKMLTDSYPAKRFRLIVAGRGEEADALSTLSADLGVEGQVQFIGFREDVTLLLTACDVFLFPSLWEGLPVALLEAMAAGAPVVASDIPSVRECVQDSKTGMLAEVKNADIFCQKIIALIEDSKLRFTISRNARCSVEKHFSPKNIAEKYLFLYLPSKELAC